MGERNRDLTRRLDRAWATLNATFPFEGYIRGARKPGYFSMVRKVVKWSGQDARVLDFGAGPCDKTALFALIGMRVTAYDDLQDAWHKLAGNREKILAFAESVGISYYLPDGDGHLSIPEEKYDVVMAHDVLEHLHESPRALLNTLLQYLRPGGILAITVPNAANLRKRLHLMMGRTNYNRFEYFYWYPGLWRGHVREYVRRDLELLRRFLGLELLALGTFNLELHVLPPVARRPYRALAALVPGIRDSWMLVARKPDGWTPRFEPNAAEFEGAFGGQYYKYARGDFDWQE